jgi:hypothetical protein
MSLCYSLDLLGTAPCMRESVYCTLSGLHSSGRPHSGGDQKIIHSRAFITGQDFVVDEYSNISSACRVQKSLNASLTGGIELIL